MILNEPLSNTLNTPKEALLPVSKSYDHKQTNSTHSDNHKTNNHKTNNHNSNYSDSQDYFFVRNAGRYERVEVDNILFIKASGSYSQIITKFSTFTLAINMKSILAQIFSDKIEKCHRSFAVNIDCIKAFDDISIFITYNEKQYELPLSVTYRKNLHVKLPRLKA